MAQSKNQTSRGTAPRKRRSGKNATEGQKQRAVPSKKVLGNLNVSTEIYTAQDVDDLLAANRLIEDEDIPGDFYMISIKSGRLIIRKVADQE